MIILAPVLVLAAAVGGDTAAKVALDYGFRFASAIHTDVKDQGMAQESVVLEYARLVSIDEALRRADQVVGWRRGTVYADLAHMLAEQGRVEEARALVQKAESFQKTITGWEERRIAAHVAQALALLGELDRAREIATSLADGDPRQYTGRSTATEAAGHAARGDFDEAMRKLHELDTATDFDVTWWRTVGFLNLARGSRPTPAQRQRALDAARKSADGIAGWKRAEALQEIAAEYAARGERESAREALEAAEAIVKPLPATMPTKAAMIGALARGWGKAGEKARAHALLEPAEAQVAETMVIDRPGGYAALAASHAALGNGKEAARLYDRAFGAAEALVNARPRALSVVEITRSLAEAGYVADAPMRARLDKLFSGLQAPW
jgi:tetratricopeptide (TPR) repeat protein